MNMTALSGSIAGLALASIVLTASSAHAQQAGYTWHNVQIVGGGYVPGVIFNQTEPGLVYARTDIGGAYRQDPVTEEWIPLLDWVGWDKWGYTGVVSAATDPVEPSKLYLAVGGYTNEWDPNNGAILRSDNYGETFAIAELPFKLGGNMPGRSMGERLAIDPNDNSILYLGAPGVHDPGTGEDTLYGLWRSTDSGETWEEVASYRSECSLGPYIQSTEWEYTTHPVGVTWVTFDPSTGSPGSATQTIYVGAADTDAPSVCRSTDGGSSWEPVPEQPQDGFMPHHGVLASTGMLYLPYNMHAGPYDGESGDVWRYNTQTGAWTRISPVPSDDPNGDCYFGYGGLAVDAQNPDTIMVSAFNAWWPDTIIWRSLDQGETWTKIWDWTRYPNRSFRYVQDISAAPWLDLGVPQVNGRPGAEVSPKLGWMVGDLEIDPFNSDRMMYGTGATLYGSDNLTAWDAGNQITIEVMAQGIEETSVLDLISPPWGAPLVSGLGDIAGFRHDDLNVVPEARFENPTWSTTTGLDFAELNPSFMVRVGNGAEDGDDIKSAGYSLDGGTSWTPVRREPAGLSGGGNVAVNADGTSIVWSPRDAAVHYSTNNGAAWTASAGIPAGAQLASDRVNPNVVYGFADGTVYVSTDAGASFVTGATNCGADCSLPTGMGRLSAVPGIDGDVWLVGGDAGDVYGLWHSTNGGLEFTKLGNVDEADQIGFGMAAAGKSYPAIYLVAKVGDVRGVFRSDDAGESWVRINDDQHQYAVIQTITGDPRLYGRVYLGTNGRGIVYGDLAACSSAEDCDDEDPCTVEACNDGVCSSTPLDCDDGDDCTDDVCSGNGECVYSDNGSCTACTGSEECDDGDDCTDNVCSGGFCRYPDNGSCACVPTGLVVSSLEVELVDESRGNKRGRATVEVTDDCGYAASGVEVVGTFSGTFNETRSEDTDANGVAVIDSAATTKGDRSFTFCVDELDGAPYQPDEPVCASH
jgi:xyloglucan-specific exo-beta-1,4-glucanase